MLTATCACCSLSVQLAPEAHLTHAFPFTCACCSDTHRAPSNATPQLLLSHTHTRARASASSRARTCLANVAMRWGCCPLVLLSAACTGVLLAAASSAGWVHVYQPCVAGEQAWRRLHSGVHAGKAGLAFSPDGGYLALSAGERWA